MLAFSTHIEIQSPAEHVWRVLTDLPKWVEWNHTIERTEGHAVLGAKVTVFVKANPGRAFPVRVTGFDAPRRMVWTGGMPFGLFRGRRTYELASPSMAETTFRMHEEFSGLLAGVIGKSIPDLQPAFDEFALCLKREVERQRV